MRTSRLQLSAEPRGPWPRVLGLLVLLALAASCATAGEAAHGWFEPGLPADVDDEVLEEGAEAEAARAVTELWAVASGVQQVGARLSFTFWSERGALTLVGYTASGRNGIVGEAVDDEATRRVLSTLLRSPAQQRTGGVQLTLERQETTWKVGYARLQGPRPPEAKTLPVRRAGLPAERVVAVTQGLGQLLKTVELPGGGEAEVAVAVHLEDGRTEEWELQRFELTRRGQEGGKAQRPGPLLTHEATWVVLPFTQGLGERTVHLRLRLVSPPGSRHTSGWVEEARVVRPPPPPQLNAQAVTEYRLLWEDILRRWREDTREGASWVASQGVEHLGTWYASGILVKGIGWLGIRTLPTVMRALSRGGEAAAGWLRTTLKRLPLEQRQAFEGLWTKAHLEGKRALSKEERKALRELMEGLEQLVRTPLDASTKRDLRLDARQAYKRFHPEFTKVLDDNGSRLPIHHKRQLEHAHLFPDEDINAKENLAMLTQDVHVRINALWNKFRQARPQASAVDVDRAGQIINDRFKPWYDQPTAPQQVPYSLQEAEEFSLKELQRLFPELK